MTTTRTTILHCPSCGNTVVTAGKCEYCGGTSKVRETRTTGHTPGPSLLAWYRYLRSRHRWSVCASVWYAIWLVR
jgi:hypothetical protein